MLRMLNACESCGLASTSTLTTSTLPAYFAASFSISGATILHGPHHDAQKSTRTGLSFLITIDSNVASVAALMSAMRDPFSPLPGDRLNETVGLEDARVGEAVIHGAAVPTRRHEAGAAKNGQVLAHVRDLAADPNRQVADGELAFGERLQDAQSLGI